jgi:DNA-binding CsgD family transcriptional regulator
MTTTEAKPLTRRETQIACTVADGLSNQEIADQLSISVETVKEHVQNILRKRQLKNRAHVAAWAVRSGLYEAQRQVEAAMA